MRGRLSSICLSLFLSVVTVETTQAASLQQQRQLYDEAKRALAKGDSGPYRRHASALRDYPLEPYLAYDDLTARLKTASNDEVEKFLAEHGDLPQASWMKLRWLRLLAARGDWRPFVAHYDPKMNFTELDCLYGQYQLISGQKEQGYATAEKLWLVGKSQHNACDALFERWEDEGQLTEALRWKRAKLAVEIGNYGLAKFLVKSLPTLKAQGELLLDVAQKPQLLSQPERFSPATETMGDVVSIGLRRLARVNPEQALGLLDSYARRMSFSAEEKVSIARQIGLTLAKRFDPRALKVMAEYDPELRDDTVSEWRARLLLRLGRWDDVYALTQRFPEELANSNRWRYWKARSLELAKPKDERAAQLYQPVAGERDFYGFLSADRIQAPYKLNHQPLALDPKLVQKVRNTAGIRRAMEFHARGQIVDGRREWYHVSRLFSRDELVAQARLAYEMEWYFPAIRTISQAKYWDDLDIRFPMAHRSSLVNAAKAREIHPSWVFAITRQESAFMADARSHVGATGLMQLMPATAKETAKRFGIPLSSPQQVLNPNINIQLGAAYLSQIYGQFNGNRVLASAAYNAGPGRVRQWLKNADHLPFDVWVENIPFDETRQYVQNVLTYSVIYGQKLNSPQPLVEWHERYFDNQR
ncbi:lytic murein transglycosylase [Pseudomonas sp. Choline-3u-10]|jgi:soluble lytic murein transglycosylase|uniref:transglycosylase SLT domain-containing protein n=1 Tax=Pseudomonadaceae TaxID=135621 RepID=UPI0006183097|nr:MULTISPECIES: transglycosylase SLT domain-containing protein [Pseudomonadaceae]MAL36628.1 lytic murein transglycosylase [Pseudomonas sp.]MBU0949697.1 transglycosylase SLT domain-containing protein [Gammaproteobacteria bacterium]KJJ61431.1 lytic transglycosylase [Pseudomonas sp. 10B238]MBK3797095.1 transglycosylase SLT domain-containing protein [Stutzerimonas stutzeri]MBK3877598.1 transglycosylase SLT domain-containing protein [Stutzerimonas stutzeri]|tara:strand:- start:651 stop:2582 length:1932 start_codon:yes stop_codon:yes gene_type:complete